MTFDELSATIGALQDRVAALEAVEAKRAEEISKIGETVAAAVASVPAIMRDHVIRFS